MSATRTGHLRLVPGPGPAPAPPPPSVTDVSLIAACRQLAPDFTYEERDHDGGRLMLARCTVNGTPSELSAHVHRGVRGEEVARLRTAVLRQCAVDLAAVVKR